MSSDKLSACRILIVIICLILYSCPDNLEPDYDIYLSIEDLFCTSVTLRVTLPDSGRINYFILDRNDSTIATFTCFDDDTLIADEGLTPDSDYSYTVRFLKDGQTRAESDPVTVHTLPTTSHDFVWEIDMLGNYGSYLRDAWIVDENHIWVVGALTIDDSTSQYSGQQNYNVAVWNGSIWEYKLIGAPGVTCDGIFYFSTNDIWIATGIIYHWNGNEWVRYHLWDMGILDNDEGGVEHIWAFSPDDIYFVGGKGSIVHYDGSTFKKLESGMDIHLKNIRGSENGDYIFIVGWEDSGESVALQLHEGTVTTLYEAENFGPNNNYGKVQAVSVINDIAYFSTRAGLWRYKYLTGESNLIISNPDVFRYMSIETSGANDVNNIMFMGLWFTTFHYNGDTWYEDRTVLDTYGEWNIYAHGGDFKDDLVVLVGYCYGGRNAIIGRGFRQ